MNLIQRRLASIRLPRPTGLRRRPGVSRLRADPEDPGLLDRLPPWLRAAPYAGAAVATSLALFVAPLFLVWFTASYSSGSAWEAVQFGINVWLFAHGVPLDASGDRLGLIPWLLAAIPVLTLMRGGMWTIAGVDDAAGTGTTGRGGGDPGGRGGSARRPPGGSRSSRASALASRRKEIVRAGLVFVATATVLTVLAGLAGRFSGASATLPWLFIAPVLVSGAAYLLAACRYYGSDLATMFPGTVGRARARLLDQATPGLRAGLSAVGLLLVIATLGCLLLLPLRWDRVSYLTDGLAPGIVGGIVVALGQLAYLPTFVVWFVSFLAGPGFGIGIGSSVTWIDADPGVLPLVPVLGVLPEPGPAPWWARLAVLIPLGAGALIGWRCRSAPGGRARIVAAGVGSLVAGVVVAFLGVLASGSMGSGRLSDIGVNAWVLGPILAAELFVGASLTIVVGLLWSRAREARHG